MVQWVKNLPAVQETQEKRVQSLDQEDTLEEEMATCSIILAWRISRTEEPGLLQASARAHARTHTHTHTHILQSNHIYGKFRKSPHIPKKRSRLVKYLGNLKLTSQADAVTETTYTNLNKL